MTTRSPNEMAPAAPPNLRAHLRTPKTAELVADHIRGLILHGQLKEGDFLQPELQLMETLHVSRPTLREAIRVLESEDFILVVRGSRSGARVRLPGAEKLARYAGFVLQGERTRLAEVYDAREIIEPALVSALARRHTADQIKALREAIEASYAALGQGDRRSIGASLALIHKAIVEQYGNRPLALLARILQQIVERHQSNVAAADNDPEDAYAKRIAGGLKSMSRLVDLIEAGEADRAAEHWRLHIANAKARWLAGHAETTLNDIMG